MSINRNQIAREALPHFSNATTASRTALKKLCITVINSLSHQQKVLFHSKAGVTINKHLQTLPRGAYQEIIAVGVGYDPDEMTYLLNRLAEAAKDDSSRAPASVAPYPNAHREAWDNTHSMAVIKRVAGDVQLSGSSIECDLSTGQVEKLAEVLMHLRGMDKNMADEYKVSEYLPFAYRAIINATTLDDCPFSLADRSIFDDGSEPSTHINAHIANLHAMVSSGGDIDFTIDDHLDDESKTALNYIVDNIKRIEAVDEKEEEQTRHEPCPIDPSFKEAVDTLLGKATGGYFKDISSLMQSLSDTLNANSDLTKEVERLKSAAVPVTVMPSTGTSTTPVGELTYTMTMQKAADLFPAPDGGKSRLLDFEIPFLQWFDSDGNEVKHPDTPAINPNYQFREAHLVKFLTAFKFRQNIWLHGNSGTGKTTLVEQIAARIGFIFARLNLDSNIERPDIVGGVEIQVENGAPVTKFREGILPAAMQQPCFFCLDEVDAGRPDILFVIQRALEGKGLTLTEDGGRLVQQHAMFSFVGTANSRGQGDEYGWYAGVRPLNLAFLNRFGAFIEIDYLDREDESRLLQSVYPALDKVEVDNMAVFAEKVRAAFKNGEVSQTVSPRNLHAMAMYYLHYKSLYSTSDAMKQAVETAVIDSAPADNAERLRQIYERCF